MGVPQTLPANFDGFDKAPATLPADFSQWDQPKQPSAASRLGTNFLSGAGVTSNEQAKNFFVHPLDTVIKSFEAQGQLAKKARDAYDRGDYMEALQHGLNYLVPFVGQQTDQAGTQLKEGDIAGGIGRTLGAALPIVAGSPEVQFAASEAASTAAAKGAAGVRAAARGANTVLAKAPGTIGGAVGAAAGHATGVPGMAEVGGAAGAFAGKEILPQVRIPGEGFGLPSRVTGGPETLPPLSEAEILRERLSNATPQSALDRLRNQPLPAEQPDYAPERPNVERISPQASKVAQPAATAAPAAEEPAATPTAVAPAAAAPSAIPKKFAPLTDLEKQINDALGGKPLQRGVSLRNQGKANALPQGFTPVDSSALKGYKYDPASQEFSSVTNNGQIYTHAEVTPEEVKAFEDADSQGKAWNTIRQNHVLVKQNGLPVKPSGARSVMVDPETGRPEFSDVLDAKQAAKQTASQTAKKKRQSAPESDDDLTAILMQSLAKVRAQKGIQ